MTSASRRRDTGPGTTGSGSLVPIPRRELIHEAVQSALRAYIVERRLGPGDPLPPEGDLARALEVSRSSVREAVKALEGIGVIEARKGSGLYVREFNIDALLDHLAFGMIFDVRALVDILDIRLIIESGMVERVVHGVRPEQLSSLDSIVAGWRIATERGEYSAAHDREFHAALYGYGVNPLVVQILDAFWRVFYQARARAVVPEPADPRETFSFHIDILDALRAGDVAAMRVAVNAHHEGIKRRVEIAAERPRQGRGLEVDPSEGLALNSMAVEGA